MQRTHVYIRECNLFIGPSLLRAFDLAPEKPQSEWMNEMNGRMRHGHRPHTTQGTHTLTLYLRSTLFLCIPFHRWTFSNFEWWRMKLHFAHAAACAMRLMKKSRLALSLCTQIEWTECLCAVTMTAYCAVNFTIQHEWCGCQFMVLQI